MGRILGAKTKATRKDINLTCIKLQASKDFASQLREFRLILNMSMEQLSDNCGGWAVSNIHHFETRMSGLKSNPYKGTANNLPETALRYAKGLGVKKIEIIL